MKEQQAKSRYVMKVRQLKTFGITFFECKQRIPGKKDAGTSTCFLFRLFRLLFFTSWISVAISSVFSHVVPYLIGVTKAKIIKMDPETQKEIKSWTFEQLRRWVSACCPLLLWIPSILY